MTTPRVMLTQLSEHTSARGTRYFAGYMGRASVVMFLDDEPDKYGNPRWSLFVSEPQQHEGYAGGARGHGPGAQGNHNVNTLPSPDRAPGWRGPSAYRRPRAPSPAGPLEVLDDDLQDLGR